MFHEACEGGVDDVLELLCQYRGTRPVKDWPIENAKTSLNCLKGRIKVAGNLLKLEQEIIQHVSYTLCSIFHAFMVQLSHCPSKQSWGGLYERRIALSTG